MTHTVTYKVDAKYFKTHTLRCSCQWAGEFVSKEDAQAAATAHVTRHSSEPNFSSKMVGFESKEEGQKEAGQGKVGGPLF